MTVGISGEIYHDPMFRFSDGKIGNKLFVVICDSPNSPDHCCVLKTTSQRKDPRFIGVRSADRVRGCYAGERWPNFFVPSAESGLSEDTWIQLEEVFLYEHEAFKSWKPIRTLSMALTRDLLRCTTQSDFIEADVLSEVQKLLKVI